MLVSFGIIIDAYAFIFEEKIIELYTLLQLLQTDSVSRSQWAFGGACLLHPSCLSFSALVWAFSSIAHSEHC
jgi:hypothetical protein